jgi:hypothetical protein
MLNRREIDSIVVCVLAGVDGDIIAGPLMTRRSDGIAARAAYFSVATHGVLGFTMHRVNVADIEERERIIVALTRRGCAVWPMRNDDIGEMQFMGIVEEFFPGELERLRERRRAVP